MEVSRDDSLSLAVALEQPKTYAASPDGSTPLDRHDCCKGRQSGGPVFSTHPTGVGRKGSLVRKVGKMTLWENDEMPPIEEEQRATQKKSVNPCIALYGSGKDGQLCQGCVHLRYPLHQPKRFWKCDLRKLTRNQATDHRVRWPACGRYHPREGDYQGG